MILKSEADTADLGAALARVARQGDVITLSGPLGVGKTALARGFIAALGHETDIPSPTFAIVQPYDALDPSVWHVDLYRIEDAAEIEE
ncbi:MAG TPA: tRNA (adenosine(37)-N6)-threonylcarbamoyltransferase complex ATPase subunit type 1 TsaE, partial [Sphingomicrobium sp.]|nr:tRNA (adenosine(37)-N6)-threonylcarbamoyltransferase complex ATPase subunit type 1 TsaE [Sphingomicrobium sp.]